MFPSTPLPARRRAGVHPLAMLRREREGGINLSEVNFGPGWSPRPVVGGRKKALPVMVDVLCPPVVVLVVVRSLSPVTAVVVLLCLV